MKTGRNLLMTGVIDVEQWNRAKWKAVLFASDNDSAPFFGLAFEDEKAAIDIFQTWIKRFGSKDIYDEIRVSVIEGDIPGEEFGYSVHINTSLDNMLEKLRDSELDPDKSLIMTIGRINRMNPEPSSRNLENFKNEYRKHLSYKLFPAVITPDMKIKPLFEYAIEKNEIFFRKAEEIEKSDIDSVVFNKK